MRANAFIDVSGPVFFYQSSQPYRLLGTRSCKFSSPCSQLEKYVQAGGSPTYTLTEDFALGMEMLKRGWKCRYVSNYLAVGESPEQIRNCYQQRSRWVKVMAAIMTPNRLP